MHLKSWTRLWAIVGLLAVPFGASAADDPDKNVTEKVLDILRDQGSITEQQYEDLKNEAAEERRTAALPAVSAAADPKGFKVYWKDGFRFERNDGFIKMKLGGRVHFDMAGATAQRDLDRAISGIEGTGVDFRRARFFMSGSFGEHGIFKAQYDFAGQDNDFKDVYAGLRKLPVVGTLRVGHFKEPAGLEQQMSSKYITFLERGLPDIFTPGRNAGIGINNTAHDDRMTWAVSFQRNVNDSGEDFSSSGNYNLTGRVTGLPIFEEEGKRLLHIGGWYSHQFRDMEVLRYRSRPEANTISRLVDTGSTGIVTKGVDLVGLELAFVDGPLSIQGEYMHSFVATNGGAPSVDFGGHYMEASYFLTGEQRQYKQSAGAFDRTKPKSPFSLSEGSWGAWQVATRWSRVDLSDGPVRGGILTNYSLGVNWYLYSNLRFMTNYVLGHRNGLGDVHIFQSRVSLDF
jgi:phosphate-selective porin OprO/OprP